MEDRITLDGTTWQVDPGFNMYVDVTTACNASCAFCIAPTAGRKDGLGFTVGLERALELTGSVNGTVQVVGGEPLISRRLPGVLDAIGRHSFRRVVVNTNGSNLTADLIAQMKSAGVTHVNISRHHYNERRNQSIMHLRPELPNAAVSEAAQRIMNAGMKVRMQCNLIKENIDSVQSMIEYIRWCAGLGCDTVSFSQLFPLSLFEHQKPIELGYTESAQVDLRRLVSELDASGQFEPVDPATLGITFSKGHGSDWGHQKRRFWNGPRNSFVSIKTLSGYDAAGLPNETRYDKSTDPELQEGFLAFAVVHPDGKVTASWNCGERVLYDPSLSPASLVGCRGADWGMVE